MASKLRRPPLLAYDKHFNYVTSSTPPQPQQQQPQPSPSSSHNFRSPRKQLMECGLSSKPAAAFASMNAAAVNGSTVVASSNNNNNNNNNAKSAGNKELHVNFQPESKDMQDRKKYLTAKYGPHQMNLIRKRLAVEYWLSDQLILLFDDKDCEVELDLDELLDIDGDVGKRIWVQEKLINAKRSQDIVQKFVEELLARAKTL